MFPFELWYPLFHRFHFVVQLLKTKAEEARTHDLLLVFLLGSIIGGIRMKAGKIDDVLFKRRPCENVRNLFGAASNIVAPLTVVSKQ